MSDFVGRSLLNQSLEFQNDVNRSLQTHNKKKNKDDTVTVFLNGKHISVHEIVVLKETLGRQLPPHFKVGFRLCDCKFEDDLALECFQAYLLELQSNHHPITKLILTATPDGSGTRVSYRWLRLLLRSLGTDHLTTLTISLLTDNADDDNDAQNNTNNEDSESLQLWESIRCCKALEKLALTTCCDFLGKEGVRGVLCGLRENHDDNNNTNNQSLSFLPNLKMLRLENFHTNDSGIEVMANELMGLAAALNSLRLVELDLDCSLEDESNSLEPPSLIHLAHLCTQLPAHFSMGLSLCNSPELFSSATPDQVELFARALEHRPCWSYFMLDNVGLEGPQAKRIFQALETMELRPTGDEFDDCDVWISGSRILEDEDAWEQLMESLPKMKHIEDLTVDNVEQTAQDWPAEKDEQLLNALEQNTRLCYMGCIISGENRLFGDLRWNKAILPRNKMFRDLPKVLGTISQDTSPPGWVADVLEQFAFGRGGELCGVDVAYRVLRHEAENIWK